MIIKDSHGTYQDTETGFNIYTSFDAVGPAIQARRDAIISIDGEQSEKYTLEVNLLKTAPYHFSEMAWKGEAIKYGSRSNPNGTITIAEGAYQEIVDAFKARCNIDIVSFTDMQKVALDRLKLGDEPIPITPAPSKAEE